MTTDSQQPGKVGDVNSNEPGSGARYNAGKPAYELVPLIAFEGCARVFDFGRAKYAPWNWAKGMAWSAPFGCLMRHLSAWQRGENTDPESGLPHLDHAMANLVMLTTYARTYPQGDDRTEWLRATEAGEAPDLRKAVADLREVMGKYCGCRARLAADCSGEWEPGCDMGANEAHAVPAGEDAEVALQQAINLDEFPNLAEFVENAPAVLDRYGAKDLSELIEKLKAQRAARWANAPQWARFVVQYFNGHCCWFEVRPVEKSHGLWVVQQSPQGRNAPAGFGILGRVACEPRPRAKPEQTP